MIHFKRKEKGFEYWFTQGISINDLKDLVKMEKEYAAYPERISLETLNDKEYFPTTRKFKNIYTMSFLGKKELDELNAKRSS